MSDMAIVIAKTEGGLYAVAKDAKFNIISNTIREFTSLATCPDVPSIPFGSIDANESGWIALAEHQ